MNDNDRDEGNYIPPSVAFNKRHENWMNNHWRPAMGWVYMATCIFDFILAPLLWPVFAHITGVGVTAWVPLTLQGGGLYHMSMGAILGVTAWTNGQENMNKFNWQMRYSDPILASKKEAARNRPPVDPDKPLD